MSLDHNIAYFSTLVKRESVIMSILQVRKGDTERLNEFLNAGKRNVNLWSLVTSL